MDTAIELTVSDTAIMLPHVAIQPLASHVAETRLVTIKASDQAIRDFLIDAIDTLLALDSRQSPPRLSEYFAQHY